MCRACVRRFSRSSSSAWRAVRPSARRGKSSRARKPARCSSPRRQARPIAPSPSCGANCAWSGRRRAGLPNCWDRTAGAAAVGVGAFHNYLEYTHQLECPAGIANVGTAPQQALVAEVVVLLILLMASLPRFFPAVLSVGLGAVLAALLIQSAPKLPPAP